MKQVRAGEDAGDAYTVPLAEDPRGRVKQMQGMWAVRHCIEAGVQQPNGKVQRENVRVIRPGDFVDVAVTIHAVQRRLPKGRRVVEVMFAPQTIIRLIPSENSVVRKLHL